MIDQITELAATMGLPPDDVLWWTPRRLDSYLRGHQRKIKNQLVMAAQTAIMIGHVNGSYQVAFHKRGKRPINRVDQLIRVDGENGSGGHKVPEELNTKEKYYKELNRLMAAQKNGHS